MRSRRIGGKHYRENKEKRSSIKEKISKGKPGGKRVLLYRVVGRDKNNPVKEEKKGNTVQKKKKKLVIKGGWEKGNRGVKSCRRGGMGRRWGKEGVVAEKVNCRVR